MKRFEHYQEVVEASGIDKALIEREEKGWELVDVCHYMLYREHRYRLFFKRPVKKTACPRA